MRVVVIGGGGAGLFTALLSARAGHEVVVVEQDPLREHPDVESAALVAHRTSAPQIVQPHIVMAHCRELLAARLPDVYERVLGAGAAEVPLAVHMPPTLTDRARRPGDERLTTLATRRSTLDWAVQQMARVEPRVTIRDGVRLTGLLSRPDEPPRVVGVQTSAGDVFADVVVDACGRRSAVDRWLQAIGARPASNRWAACGLAYFTRHYRVRPGVALPGPPTTRLVVGLDEFTAGIWGADNGVMQLAVAPLATDRRFRGLRDPEVHAAVLRTVPALAPWLEGLDPITDVFQMAGLHNTLRRLVDDGGPVVTGLHSVGDSVCTTNPTLGRGLALALAGAAALVAVLDEHPDDPLVQAQALDAHVEREVLPYYEDQAAIDGARLAMLRHTIEGAPAPSPPPATADRVTYAQLRTAAAFDPTAFRGFWNVQGMIRKPEDVYRDPDIVASTQSTLASLGGAPTVPQPTREEVLAALAGGEFRSTARS